MRGTTVCIGRKYVQGLALWPDSQGVADQCGGGTHFASLIRHARLLQSHPGKQLPAGTRDALVARLLGGDADAAAPELIESALREVGNIVVSHVCSAVADTLATRLLPSLPVLARAGGERELAAVTLRRGGGRLRLETEIIDAQGELCARLVFVPDP